MVLEFKREPSLVRNRNEHIELPLTVADFLRVSESTIRKLVKEKRIPYFKLEGRYLFCRGALEKWANDLTIEPEKGSTKGDASQKAEEIWDQRKGK